MVYFSFMPTKISHSIGRKLTLHDVVTLELTAKNVRDFFEIGESHLIGYPVFHKEKYKDRMQAKVTCRFSKKSHLPSGYADYLCLSDDVVGNGFFCEKEGDLVVSIYLEDCHYDIMVSKFDSGKKCDLLDLSFEVKPNSGSGVIEYGWEPDASHVIWSTDGSNDLPEFYVQSYNLNFIDEGRVKFLSENELKSFFIDVVYKDFRDIRYALYVIVFLLLSLFSDLKLW